MTCATWLTWPAGAPATSGAGFVPINPLHAGPSRCRRSAPSPYLPMTRQLRQPAVPADRGHRRVPPSWTAGQRARIDTLAAPLAGPATPPARCIDRDAVWAAKRAALEIIHRVPLTAQRPARRVRRQFRQAARASDLRGLGRLWCALAERHGPDWRDWPGAVTRDGLAPRQRPSETGRPGRQVPRLAAVAHRRASRPPRSEAALRRRAWTPASSATSRSAAHPGGGGRLGAARTCWSAACQRGRRRRTSSTSAGRTGTQPPWHPRRLAAEQLPPAERTCSHAGPAARRRPAGRPCDGPDPAVVQCPPAGRPTSGTYIRYDHRATVGGAGRPGRLGPGRWPSARTSAPWNRWIREYLAEPAGCIGHGDALVRPRARTGRRSAAAATGGATAWPPWAPTTCPPSGRVPRPGEQVDRAGAAAAC